MKSIQFTAKSLIITLAFSLISPNLFAHGVLESPASREQFCGVESKPDEIFGDKMTHEECRPMMTKSDGTMDNSVYNFMAVLSHTVGRSNKSIDQLPQHVCGFDSEMWGGGETPWDKALNWPTSMISAGPQKFIWNIAWGNHFGDTDEFVYWITKPDFQFDSTKALSWNDFEETPFCHLKYNDSTPNANPDIVPDKINNKFITTCTVPTRTSRAVIYGEWGRNPSTYERFHSCMDVEFSTDPDINEVTAHIKNLPETITGPANIILDGTQSEGEALNYHWSISAEDLSHYQLQDSQKAKALLILSDINAQQRVTINLEVSHGSLSNRTSKQFDHLPAILDPWKDLGKVSLINNPQEGDKIQLRLIDNQGKDHLFPATALILTSETAKADIWPYALAQEINNNNEFSAKIGVLDANKKTIDPIKSATENKIYVPASSIITNGYIKVEKKEVPNDGCRGQRKEGSSSYWLGYDIYAGSVPFVLDFSQTGIDLTRIIVDKGAFDNVQIVDKNKLIINKKPDWVTMNNPGFMGFFERNYGSYDPFNSPVNASCSVSH